MREYKEPPIYGWPVEILSLAVVRTMDEQGVALLVRPDPENNLRPLGLLLSQEQAVFLRDVINEYLNDSESWFYLDRTAQQAMRPSEDFDLRPQPHDDIPF